MVDTKESEEPGTSVCPSSDVMPDIKPVWTGSAENKNVSPFDTAIQRIYQFLNDSQRLQQLDNDKLVVTFKYLQRCALSSMLTYLLDAQFLEVLGGIYDRLVKADLGKREVVGSILELLYLIEDMSESVKEAERNSDPTKYTGKIQCGKHFIERLLAFATTEVQSVNLHRAAVETLCAIITKSPANQQKVIDDESACLKLFKQCLPSCGDFQLQASLTEVYYRLLKLDPKLLDLMNEKRVREAMEALVQQQKPDLLARIKEFVFLMNECWGPLRSVYTFHAKKILLNGQNVTPSEEKLISFGKGHFSFYQTDTNIEGPTILDVEYEDIIELTSGSKSILEMVVQDRRNVLSAQVTDSNQQKQVRILVSMTPHDFSILEACVLPRLHTQTTGKKTGLASLQIRKSSIGIMCLQEKDSTLLFQPRNEAGNPVTPRGILKKSQVNICHNSSITGGIETGKDNCSEPTNTLARRKENFSEEPVIVKATPQKDLPFNLSTEPCKGVSSMQRSSAELGNKPDIRQEVSEENAVDFGSSVPLSRIITTLKQSTDAKQGEHPTREQKINVPEDTDNAHRTVMGSEIDLNHRRVQAHTAKNTFKASEEIEVGTRMRFAEKDHKSSIQEENGASPRVEISDCRVNNQRGTGALRVNIKSTTDAMDCIITGYNSGTLSMPSNEVGKDGRSLVKQKVSLEPGNICGFETGPEVKEAKQPFKIPGKKTTRKAEQTVPGKTPAKKKAQEAKERSCQQLVRKYTTRQTTCKKPGSHSESGTHSDRTSASETDEEWIPDKANTDPIETESEQQKVGAARVTCRRNGSLKQSPCNGTGKKSNLPFRLQIRKSLISNGKIQHTSKVSGVQRRKTAQIDVYSFTSDEEQLQFKPSNTLSREKNIGGKRLCRKAKATTFSFPSVPEQPGKNKRQRVQKEKQQDVLIMSKTLDRRQVQTRSKTDEVQNRSRLERWKTSTFTDHTVPESNLDPEESIDVPSSDTSAGEKVPETGTDIDVPGKSPLSADDHGLHVITTMIKEFRDKVKSDTKRKMADIVNNTCQLIQQGIEGTQRLIQKDVADFVQISKEKYRHINSKLEGQTTRMQQIYEQFQKDFNEHVQQYEKIIEEIDGTDHDLIEVARKKGQEHKELFERLQETSMRHIAEADQKILAVSKASEEMYGLRSAVEGLVCLEH